RNSLHPMAEFGRIEKYLREAEALARRLDDPRRLGWVSAYMSGNHVSTGGRATDLRTFAQRVEAIATTLADVPLQVAAHFYLLVASNTSGDYPGTEHASRRLVQLLPGDQIRERFGLAIFPAVLSRAHLGAALADQGAFDEGEAHGQDAIRI